MHNLKRISFFILLLALNSAKIAAQSPDSLLIHFDFNKYSISGSDSIAFRHFIDMHHNASATDSIEVFGYCDSIGSINYNINLSRMRILAVTAFYANAGADCQLIKTSKAFGKANPLNDNADEMKRAINRRVLIISPAVKTIISAEIIKKETIEKPIVKPDIFNDSALKVGQNIILENLNFIGGRHFLLPGSELVLEHLLDVMKHNPQLKIEIDGYVCCTNDHDGLDIDTQTGDLSVQRAKYVYDYLLANRIKKTRISYQGFGGRNKIYPDEISEAERSANRRIEVKIISK